MSKRALLLADHVTRCPAVRVGDLIQYRYRYSYMGSTLTTGAVTEVFDDGAFFTVEGGYIVYASAITAHIPMHGEPGETAGSIDFDDDEFTRP